MGAQLKAGFTFQIGLFGVAMGCVSPSNGNHRLR